MVKDRKIDYLEILHQTCRVKLKELTSVGQTFINTCRSYIHTLCDFRNGTSLAWRLHRCISTIMFTCGWVWPTRWPIRPIRSFREQSSQKLEILCLGCRWTAVQNLITLALSSVEKSDTYKHTHKKNTNSNRYICTLSICMCGE